MILPFYQQSLPARPSASLLLVLSWYCVRTELVLCWYSVGILFVFCSYSVGIWMGVGVVGSGGEWWRVVGSGGEWWLAVGVPVSPN